MVLILETSNGIVMRRDRGIVATQECYEIIVEKLDGQLFDNAIVSATGSRLRLDYLTNNTICAPWPAGELPSLLVDWNVL